jgi:hypothetical protein
LQRVGIFQKTRKDLGKSHFGCKLLIADRHHLSLKL